MALETYRQGCSSTGTRSAKAQPFQHVLSLKAQKVGKEQAGERSSHVDAKMGAL